MSEIKETEKNHLELEKSLYNLRRYYDEDDTKYQGIRDIRHLFDKVDEVDEDYYKPIKTKSAFNGNYIDYESKGDKDKNLSPKEYLDMIRPYISDMINDDKTRTMHTKSHDIEIMWVTKQMTLSKNFLNLFYKIIKKI